MKNQTASRTTTEKAETVGAAIAATALATAFGYMTVAGESVLLSIVTAVAAVLLISFTIKLIVK